MVQLSTFKCPVPCNKLIEIFAFFRTSISACLVGINPSLVGGQLTLSKSLKPIEVREESKFPCHESEEVHIPGIVIFLATT